MITVQYGQQYKQLGKNTTFLVDPDETRSVIFDYAGELGADTVSSAIATVKNITAGTPSISGQKVTVSMSGGVDGANATLELDMTTAASDVISRTVTFKVRDL